MLETTDETVEPAAVATEPLPAAPHDPAPMDNVALQPAPTADPLVRLRGIPVQISVRLAEKRIPVSHLLGVTPGALIAFNKSCDALLDLYINNALYCRGEAVKIGEHFGLKINQVGVTEERPSKLVNG
jgi:flagellar motor switch protein FliN/FliY